MKDKEVKHNVEEHSEPKKVKRYAEGLDSIKPCPFCGNKNTLRYLSPFIAYIGCDECDITMGFARVLYKRDELPEELKEYQYEPKLLSIIGEDGVLRDYPEHGYVGVSAVAALDHAGVLEKWNRRAS